MLPSHSFNSTSDRAKKKGYYSFGDEGLTATVGASGQLLRISRHFPGKRTGFCVDEPDMQEPFRVTPRLKQFLYRAEDASFEKGIGTYVDVLHLNRQVYYSELIHDRWPAFKIGSLDVNLDLQYAILDGTVYQTFKFDYSQITRNGSKPPSPPIVRLRGDSLIRNLDYITLPGQNPFNNANDSGYKPARLEGGTIFREHEEEDGYQAFLSIAAFNDERGFEFVKAPVLQIGEMPADYLLGWDYLLKWDEQASKDIDHHGRLSVTVAYTLGYDQSPVTPVDTVKFMKQLDLSTIPYEAQIFSNNPSLDVCLRKNLEHVLSVCSIPVFSTRIEEEPTVALTCGDVDSHFVSTAASFYCFQILLLALKHFQSRYDSLTAYENDPNYQPTTNGTKSYVHGMMNRIKRVCKGHMRWLFKTSNTSGKLFCPYYWVNGDEIEEWQLGDLLSRKSLVDTPFQVIKVCDFYDMSSDDFDGDDMGALERIVRTWIQEIYNHKVDTPGLYAFPRYDTEPTRTFYLTDHAVIWQAMKSAEDIGIQLPASPECSSKHIQESILEMFDTPNPSIQQRLLSVKRNPAKTRFVFRSTDTALFRAAEMGLFDKPARFDGQHGLHKQFEIWERTIQYQIQHYAHDTINRTDPRRLALPVVMGHFRPFNTTMGTSNPDAVVFALLELSSDNGIFPGVLDERSRPVSCYENELLRGKFWGTTFEIPYLLWKYSHTPNFGHHPSRKRKKLGDNHWDRPLQPDYVAPLAMQSIAQPNLWDGVHRDRYNSQKASHIPLNNMLSHSNIRELQDEWLYNPPTFFISAAVIQKAREGLGNLMAIPADLIYLTFTGAVVDIPKSRPVKTKMSKNKIPMRVLQNATDIQNVVDAGRTAEEAKKRFWAFFASTPSENEVCIATIPVVSREDREEQEMRSFFQRHNSYDNFFAEDTAALLNTWTTELHLSFYTLLHDDRPGAPPSDDTLEAETFHFTTLSGVEAPRYLRKFAAGFRLKGDFFDRYWTCNFLEANPSRADDYPWKEGVQEEVQREVQALLERQFEGGRITEVEKNSWQQRRILELILFERIMQKMNESTRGILEWATSVLMGTRKRLQKTLSPTKGTKATRPHYKDLLDTIKEFREFQKAIRRMGRHYAEALANIDRWRDREKGRELERPRWTFNDESRYRVIILKLLASNDDSIQTPRRNQDKITNLIEMELDLMRGDLEFMRSELNQTQDENIKLFTVITTIFVPLGFAASIFSMDEAPETSTLYYMLATAAGAFLFTGAMLWIIKEVDLRKPYGEFKGLFRRDRTDIEDEDTESDEDEDEEEADVGSSPDGTLSTNGMSVLPDLESPGRRSWSFRTYNKERARKHNDLEATIGVQDVKGLS